MSPQEALPNLATGDVVTTEEWEQLSAELERIGLLHGIKATSFKRARAVLEAAGLGERGIYEKYSVELIEYREGKRRVSIRDGAFDLADMRG